MSRDLWSNAANSSACATITYASAAERAALSAAHVDVPAAASAASFACSMRPESSPPVKRGRTISARVIPVFKGAASFGSLATNSGNENVPWLSFRANVSAGLFVRMKSAVRLSDGSRMALAWETRASAAPWRAFAAVTSRALSRAFCMAAASVRGAPAAPEGCSAARAGPASAAARERRTRGLLFPFTGINI